MDSALLGAFWAVFCAPGAFWAGFCAPGAFWAGFYVPGAKAREYEKSAPENPREPQA